MVTVTRILYITCANEHSLRKIAKIQPRADFNDIFGPEKLSIKPSNAGLHVTRSLSLIWVNTPSTLSLRAPEVMPSGTTDLDRKWTITCFQHGCQHPVLANEGTLRRLVYEPATGAGRTQLDITELESMLTITTKKTPSQRSKWG